MTDRSDHDRLRDQVALYVRRVPPAERGGEGVSGRHEAAFKLAGHLCAFIGEPGGLRLTKPEIHNFVIDWNARNSEPISEDDVAHAVDSAWKGNGTPREDKVVDLNRRYGPEPSSKASSEDAPASEKPGPWFSSASELIAQHPRLREPVVRGLLRVGEVANVIGAPKMRKSWLAADLAISVTTGADWLGNFPTNAGRVLLIDNELHGETIADRLPRIAEARGLARSHWQSDLFVASLRGRHEDIATLGTLLASIEPGHFRLIILDALYRFLPEGCDENDNAAITRIYNKLDAYACRLGCAFLVVHHTSKGDQSGKSVTDVGSGAGSQSRAADSHIVIRQHEEDDAAVLDATLRSWSPIEPLGLRWDYPIWTVDPELDTEKLRRSSRSRKNSVQRNADQPPPQPWTAERFVETFISHAPVDQKAIIGTAQDAGLSVRQAKSLIAMALSQRLAFRAQDPKSKIVFISTSEESP